MIAALLLLDAAWAQTPPCPNGTSQIRYIHGHVWVPNATAPPTAPQEGCEWNVLSDIEAAFQAHPDWPLAFSDFVLHKANWESKGV